MPRLLLFAPAEKVILDQGDRSLSLISVLQGLEIERGSDAEPTIPENVVANRGWGVATIWLRLPGEEGKTFEQRVEIEMPDGQRVKTTDITFKMTHLNHNVALNGQGFPVGIEGQYHLYLFLREVGTEQEWEEIAAYPVQVRHVRQQQQTAHATDRAEP